MNRRKVMVAGVFDIIHPGHIYLITKASELGDVIVVVARDSTVKRLKGRRPVIPEGQRLEVVRSLKKVDEAFLGHEGVDMLRIVEEIKPDVILLGPDQAFTEEDLKRKLEARGLNIEIKRLKEPYRAHNLCSTSKIIKEIIDRSKELESSIQNRNSTAQTSCA
ncbi:MAG: FAD synthase [Candidatus Nezhaarchaeota archaeon]|nr:FAD synthase [Candidatus Nezhaarchaeota archaeon]